MWPNVRYMDGNPEPAILYGLGAAWLGEAKRSRLPGLSDRSPPPLPCSCAPLAQHPLPASHPFQGRMVGVQPVDLSPTRSGAVAA